MIVAGVGLPTISPSRTNTENSRRISQDSNDGEIGSIADGDVREEEVISALTGLHWETKLHFTAEADSVPTSQCKRDVVSVRERLSGKGIQQRRRYRQPGGKTGPKSR